MTRGAQAIRVNWPDPYIGVDIIPLSLLVPGKKRRAVHKIVWRGGESPAWCDRTVQRTQAVFDYGIGNDARALAKLNEGRCEIGVMRFSYPNLDELERAK